MKVHYLLEIPNPETHIIRVTISTERPAKTDRLSFFLPSWSPGSYLMREYAKNVQRFKAESANGAALYWQQTNKGVWEIDWTRSELSKSENSFSVSYEVYCHELTVRHSHVDSTHAFIHGPSVFMGILENFIKPTLEIRLPAGWNKISTGLEDISPKRELFLYSANDYDTFIDCPIEMGNHLTDGFQVEGKDHELAFYGHLLPHGQKIKEDIKVIVSHIAQTMREIPYERYVFISHFIPGLFGGLEHLNSTALQYCNFKMQKRKDYLGWLELVAHEYFHTWNVKRIRPIELGPFDYLSEAKTRMHWLTEGLTSFMDQLFVFRAGLMTLEEYFECVVASLNRYESTPGRHFDSVEDSSFNAWIKLYRPDENSSNSSVSYYLKGGLVFMALHFLLAEKGKSVIDLLDLLWDRFKSNPHQGMVRDEVLAMIREIGGKEIESEFDRMISTTQDIDFEGLFKKAGIDVVYEQDEKAYLGFSAKIAGDQVFVASVALDSPAHRSGLNAGDELLAIDGLRITKKEFDLLGTSLKIDQVYHVLVSRLGHLQEVKVRPSASPRKIKTLTAKDQEKVGSLIKGRLP